MINIAKVVASLATSVSVGTSIYSSTKMVSADKKVGNAKTECQEKATKSARISLVAAGISASIHAATAIINYVEAKKLEKTVNDDTDTDDSIVDDDIIIEDADATNNDDEL